MVLDNDVVPAALRKGWNALLVKISQGNGEWGFVLRIRRLAPQGTDGLFAQPAATKLGHGEDGAPPGSPSSPPPNTCAR